MKIELRMERMNLFSDAGAKSSEALFDHKADSSEALFRGNDKTFDETPWSKEYLTSTLLHKLKE